MRNSADTEIQSAQLIGGAELRACGPFREIEWSAGANLARTPAIWDEMFAAIPTDNFGLNLDPSHPVWLRIEYERAV